MQTFQVDLDQRQQANVIRRLLLRLLTSVAPFFDKILVAVVGGNHGENRGRGRRAFTTFGDNSDVGIFEQVRDACDLNPDVYGHVVWRIPNDELVVSYDVEGVRVGIAHGHQTKSPASVPKWWNDCSANRLHGLNDVDLLVTAHYHHLIVRDMGSKRTHFQCPALDNGSPWWENRGGRGTVQGTLTFLIDPTDKRGWRELAVL